jgi:hypothetical protein
VDGRLGGRFGSTGAFGDTGGGGGGTGGSGGGLGVSIEADGHVRVFSAWSSDCSWAGGWVVAVAEGGHAEVVSTRPSGWGWVVDPAGFPTSTDGQVCVPLVQTTGSTDGSEGKDGWECREKPRAAASDSIISEQVG